MRIRLALLLATLLVGTASAQMDEGIWPSKKTGAVTVLSFGASACNVPAMAGDDAYFGGAISCVNLFTNALPQIIPRAGTLRNLRCDFLDVGGWISGDGYVFTLYADVNNLTIAPGPVATPLTCATSTLASTQNRSCSDLDNSQTHVAGASFAIEIVSNNAATPGPGAAADTICSVEVHH